MTFLRKAVAGVGWDDVIGAIGVGCVLYGVSHWSPPLAWVIAGVMQMVAALWPALRRR